MKSLIAVIVLACSFAHAAEIKVYEAEAADAKIMTADFSVNPEMNRAWVDVSMQDRISGRDVQRHSASVKIDGLSFDNETQKVLLAVDGQQVECGFRKGWGIFKHVVETGCTFVTRTETRVHDDGYYTYKRTYKQLFLVTR